MQGVHELHARGWCHSDLELDNIKVRSGPGPLDFWVIIIDFGGAQHIRDGKHLICVLWHGLLHKDLSCEVQSKSMRLRVLDFSNLQVVVCAHFCAIHCVSVRISCICPCQMRLLFNGSSTQSDLHSRCACQYFTWGIVSLQIRLSTPAALT